MCVLWTGGCNKPSLATRQAGEYSPLLPSAADDCSKPILDGRGGAGRCTKPVENTYPLRAAARLNTGRILVTLWLHNPLEDPCLRAFENQARVIGWPGYAQGVKLGETNLGGAGGEVAGVPALRRLLWRPVPMPVLPLRRGRGRATGHRPRGGSFQGCYLKPRCSSRTFHPPLFLPRFPSSTVTINSCPPLQDSGGSSMPSF